jgi:hypothetical protein
MLDYDNTRSGQCNCLHGFYGELCGLTLTQAPYIEKDAVDDLCDTSKKTIVLRDDIATQGHFDNAVATQISSILMYHGPTANYVVLH